MIGELSVALWQADWVLRPRVEEELSVLSDAMCENTDPEQRDSKTKAAAASHVGLETPYPLLNQS